ncbi:MAG: hypothetical protein R3Y62_05065 [Eubacteriales bacterium]
MNLFKKKEETTEEREKRSGILRVVCAAYLLYLVYSMITNSLTDGVTGGEFYAVIAACVIFSAVALVILFFAAKSSIAKFKQNIVDMERVEQEEQEEAAKLVEEKARQAEEDERLGINVMEITDED